MRTDPNSDPEPIRAAVRLSGSVRVGSRSYMSSWLLRSSKRFAASAAIIETDHPADWSSPHVEEHMDLVVSAVLTASNFLEAMINELFTDAYDRQGLTGDGYLAPLADELVRLMAGWWAETDEGKERTLAKYQLLLAFAGTEKFDKGSEPFQSAALLVKLRNAIVHFRPETIYADDPHSLENQLRGRFAPNALMPAGAAQNWPNGVLSAGCARWAYESAEAFADALAERLGIRPNYMVLRDRAAESR